MVSVLEYAPDATSLDPPISDCSALEPPANAAISTSRPSSAKYLRCCAMMSGRYGRPSEAVATLTLRFSGVDCAVAICGTAASSVAAAAMTAALFAISRMGFPPGILVRRQECRHNEERCQAIFFS